MNDPTYTCPVCEAPSHRKGSACTICQDRAKKARAANSIHPDMREWLLARGERRCARTPCTNTEDLVVDHIVPMLYGGKTNPDNLQILCSECNTIKKANPIHAGMRAKLTSISSMVIYPCLIMEGGGLLAGAILSDILSRPGELDVDVVVDMDEYAVKFGVSRDVLDRTLEDLQDRSIVSHVSELEEFRWPGHDPKKERWIILNPMWAFNMSGWEAYLEPSGAEGEPF